MDLSLSLHAAHHLHLQALQRLRRRPATLKSYRVYVGAFLRFLEEHGVVEPTLEALSPELVDDAQDWLRTRSMGTRDGAVAELVMVMRLKSFSRWLWRRRYLKHDPLAVVERPRVPKLHRIPFTEAEVRRLLEAARMGPAPDLERALLLLGLDTGCRIGELCGLALADLDLERGSVLFRHTKNGRPRRVIFRVRRLPDGGPCLVALGAWLQVRFAQPGVDALFTNRYGEPMSVRQARRIYRGLGETAGVPNCVPHRGRHTHATELLAELPGAELQLRHRLGHVSHEVLADYVMISDRTAQDVADIASISAKWNL